MQLNVKLTLTLNDGSPADREDVFEALRSELEQLEFDVELFDTTSVYEITEVEEL